MVSIGMLIFETYEGGYQIPLVRYVPQIEKLCDRLCMHNVGGETRIIITWHIINFECINGKKCVSVPGTYLDYNFNGTALDILLADSYTDWEKYEVWNIIYNILALWP